MNRYYPAYQFLQGHPSYFIFTGMLGNIKNSLKNENTLAVPVESLDTNFFWHGSSN